MRRPSNRKPLVTFLGHIEARTKKAVFFKAHHWDEGQWMPVSQVFINHHADEIEIKVKSWLAEKNGWKEHGETDMVDDNDRD